MSVIGQSSVLTIIGKVVTMAYNYFSDHRHSQASIYSDLDTLDRSIPLIRTVVHDADRGHLQIEDGPLRDWWWQLRDALDAAADLLDDFEYLRLQHRVLSEEDELSHQLPKVRKVTDDGISFSISKQHAHVVEIGVQQGPLLKRLRLVVDMFHKVCGGLDLFKDLVSKEQQWLQLQHEEFMATRETGSLLAERGKGEILGRDDERERIVEWLLSHDSAADVSLISIVGHGGMGKTTLVRCVYNDGRIEDSFDLRLWVCVSSSFNVENLTKNMLESATDQKQDLATLPVLQERLKRKLMASKRFLLVLDDAWNDDNSSSWGQLLAPLKHGPKGSRILLTTRMDSVAEMAEGELREGTTECLRINLKGLAKDEFFSLFDRHAFAGMDRDNCRELQHIGVQIAGKLGGSPLAAKVVGDMLNSSMEEEYWEEILNNGISDLEAGEKEMMSVLRLSYYHLPEHLRPCFAYCSIFPPNYKFDKDNVVYMWMAMGFIRQSPGGPSELAEDIGEYYFNNLLKRSFFEHSWDEEEKFVIHDLMLEMAQFVCHDECLRLSSGMSVQDIPNTIRHLSFINAGFELLAKVNKWENLHTLYLMFDNIGDGDAGIFKKVLESLRSIRVLIVDLPAVERWLDAICDLTRLRYLSVSPSQYRSRECHLPSPLCKLYSLQVISLRGNFVLPQNMRSLINLRHLIPSNLSEGIPGFGKLTSLQELCFTVKDESGCKIGELRDLIHLRKLRVFDLEKVKSLEEARQAQMHNKEQLRLLTLEWNLCRSNVGNYAELDEQVLNCLRPNSSIEEMRIDGYLGAKLANWMEPLSMNNLKCIKLQYCPKWEQIRPLKKLPSLKYLYLRYMRALRSIDLDGGFPQLEALEIVELEQWEEWSESAVERANRCFPHLRRLIIRDCPKLKSLPLLPLSLTEFELENVGFTTLPSLWMGSNTNSSCSTINSSTSSSLSRISITKCSELKSTADGLLQHYLPSLEHLEIGYCQELLNVRVKALQHLCNRRSWHLHDLPAVKQIDLEYGFQQSQVSETCKLKQLVPGCHTLIIGHCPKLKALPILPLSFTEVKLHSLGLTALEVCNMNQWGNCSVLSKLLIRACPELKVLTSLPFSLRELELHDVGLTTLQICDLKQCENFPKLGAEIGQRCPLLRGLKIVECPELEVLSSLPFSLTELELKFVGLVTLEICNFKQREIFRGAGAGTGKLCSHLRRLTIEDCLKLEVLPSLPFSLSELRLVRVGLIALPKLCCSPGNSSSSFLTTLCINNCRRLRSLTEGLLQQDQLRALRILEVRNCNDLVDFHADGLQHLCSLSKLSLEYCCNMISLPPAEVMGKLTSLRELKIYHCDELASVECLKALHHVDFLEIFHCDKLVQAADSAGDLDWPSCCSSSSTFAVDRLVIGHPLLLRIEPLRKLASVRSAVIWNCGDMVGVEPWLLQNHNFLEHLELSAPTSLPFSPVSLQTLCSLKKLTLRYTEGLQSLPKLPSSLECLRVVHYNARLMERCQEDGGADWPNIKHIRCVDFSYC